MIFNDNTVDTAAQAMQALLSQQLSTIGYDKTLVYTITDDSNKEKGSYTVSDGSVTFTAYSEDTKYRKEDKVYITIPQGDFTQKKIIVGRYLETSEDEQGISYVAPIDRIIPAKTYTKYDFGVIADDIILDQEEYKIVPTEAFGGVFSSYTVRNKISNDYECALLELKLHNYLDNYNIQEGSFGVKVILITGEKKLELGETYRPHLLTEASTEEKTYKFIPLATALKNNSNHFEKLLKQVTLHNEIVKNNSWLKIEQKFCELQCHQYDFSSKDMMGNIFGYSGIQNQSVLIDISELSNIIFGGFVLYQSADFKILDLNEKKSLGEKYQEIYSKDGQFDFETYQAQMEKNIWIEELSLTFGYKQNSYTDTNILKLSTINSPYFVPTTTKLENNSKNLSLDWISFNNKIEKYELVEPSLLEDLEDYAVFWYESDPGAGDYLSGLGWKQFDTTQKYSILSTNYYPISYDSAKKVKAVLVKQIKNENPNMNAEEKTWIKLVESNPIEFLNEDLVKESSGVLWIEITDEQKDYLGLYDDNYKIINYEDYSKIRTLKVTIPETREYTKLRLDWFIPKYGTMLQAVKKGKDIINNVYKYYSSGPEEQINETEDYYIISKYYNKSSEIKLNEYKQSFGIEQYFQPSFIRNQIICKAYYDDDMSYCDEGRIDLSFGQINSNGTIYQFGIQFNDYNNPYITCTIQNDTQNQVRYSTCEVSCFLTSKVVSLTEEQITGYLNKAKIEVLGSGMEVNQIGDNIWRVENKTQKAAVLKATVEIEGQTLTSYQSVPIRYYSENEQSKLDIKGMQGTTNIKYDSSGELLNTTLYPLKLYGTYGNLTSETVKQVYQTPIEGTYKIMSQFKQDLAGYGNFVSKDYLFKFNTTASLKVGTSYTIVATNGYEAAEAKGAVTSYVHRLYMVVGENNSCAFYEYIKNLLVGSTTVDILTNPENYFYVFDTKESDNSTYYARISFSQFTEEDAATPFMYCNKSDTNLNIISGSDKKIYKTFSPSSYKAYEVKNSSSSLYNSNYIGKYLCPLITLLTAEDLPELSNNWKDGNLLFKDSISIQNSDLASSLISADNKPIDYIKFYSKSGGYLGSGHYALDENEKQIIEQPKNITEFFALEPEFLQTEAIIPPGASLPVSWKIEDQNGRLVGEKDNEGKEIFYPGDPIIKQTDDNLSFIQPYPIYVSRSNESDYYILIAYSSGQYLWQQPILIQQNLYEFEILNQWNGETNITDTSIMSPCIGAGSKNSDNQFSGVLMGKIGKSATDTNPIHGLYGFSDGAQAFGFKEDGTAFIGKSGAGRILFDGKKGTIASAQYELSQDNTWGLGKDEKTGMLLDLDDPKLHMVYNEENIVDFTPAENKMKLKSPDGGMSIDLVEGIISTEDLTLNAYKVFNDTKDLKNGIKISSTLDFPPLQTGWFGEETETNYAFKFPTVKLDWQGGIESNLQVIDKIGISNNRIVFGQFYSPNFTINEDDNTTYTYHEDVNMLTFELTQTIDGRESKEYYDLYLNMWQTLIASSKSEGESSDTEYFFDIRPNFNYQSDSLEYFYSLNSYRNKYQIPLKAWKPEEGNITGKYYITKQSRKIEIDTKYTLNIVSYNEAKARYFSIDKKREGTDEKSVIILEGLRMQADWIITRNGEQSEEALNYYTAIASLIFGFNKYETKFEMGQVGSLGGRFLDIGVLTSTDDTWIATRQRHEFFVDAMGTTHISDLKVPPPHSGDRTDVISYITLGEYVKEVLKYYKLIT